MKKYIKGFADLRIFPLTANTTSAYTPGVKVPVPYVEAASVDRKSESYEFYSDDGIYDKGQEWKGDTLEITVSEMELQLLSQLTGATFSTETSEYTANIMDIPSEYATAFKCLKADGTYRMIKYYAGKFTLVKNDQLKTKGANTEKSAYVLTYEAYGRELDGNVYIMKDGSDTTWIDTITTA